MGANPGKMKLLAMRLAQSSLAGGSLAQPRFTSTAAYKSKTPAALWIKSQTRPLLWDRDGGGLKMKYFSIATAFLAASAIATAASGADDYRVVDHLMIVKTGDVRTDPIQPSARTDDIKRDDIAAAQKCKDLGPASNDPDAEAEIINHCLDRNSVFNVRVVSSEAKTKEVLR